MTVVTAALQQLGAVLHCIKPDLGSALRKTEIIPASSYVATACSSSPGVCAATEGDPDTFRTISHISGIKSLMQSPPDHH